MSQSNDKLSVPTPVIDRAAQPNIIKRVLIFGGALILAGSAFVFLKTRVNETFLLGLLAILAVVGITYLFASVIGIIRFSPQSTGDALAKAYLDGQPQGVIVMDKKDNVVYANQAYADMIGYNSSGNASDIATMSNLFADDAHDNAMYRLNRDVLSGKQVDHEFRVPGGLDAGNSDLTAPAKWYRVRGRQLNIQEYGQTLFAWQLNDISRERDEQERYFIDLQKAIDHLDSAPAGFIATNAGFQISYLNATLSNWLGFDLGGFTPETINLADFVAGDGLALLQPVQKQNGQSHFAVIDLDLTKTNGAALPVRVLYSALFDGDGEFTGTRSVVLNRESFLSSETNNPDIRFTRFFNSTPMAIASVDGAGRILQTNAPFASLFGNSLSSDAIMRGATLDRVIVEHDRKRFYEALEQARLGKAQIAPVDTVLADNEECHVRFFVNAIAGADPEAQDSDQSGEIAIVYAMDTTEQKALEAQMAQGQKMQAVGQLAGGIAHDFNNVLSAIVLSSDLLLANHRPSDPSFTDIMSIKQNANRAASLVRQLLAFSRRQTLRPQTLNLTDVLADVRMLLQRLVGNEVTLEINHGRDLWPVRADLGQFEQVIVNLAVNARDAMNGKGSIIISTENVVGDDVLRSEMPNVDYVRIAVKDTGTGIPPSVLKKIFEPFFTTKEVGKGTGLGLSMVYGIVKQSDGFIYADSELGDGTTFYIYLPRFIPKEETEAEKAEIAVEVAPKKSDHSGSGVVLLAEDEDAVRMGAVRALKSRGYTVIEACDGAEALELYEESADDIDIVVSDVRMPEMDGPGLLTELLKIKPDIKFIFMSGYTEDALANERFEGFDYGFLSKPFSLKQLTTTVKEHLEK